MRATRIARAVAVSGLMLLSAGPAWAELDVGGFKLGGNVQLGWGFIPQEPSPRERAKWEEYTDWPNSAWLEELRLRLHDPSERYWLELEGSKWGYQDQEFFLQLGRLGLWQGGFEWNQTPHFLFSTGQFLATQPQDGVFVLPTPRPVPLTIYNTAPRIDEAVRWDTARAWFLLTPTPDLDFRGEYTRIYKHGDMPFGMSFGTPGNNFYEVLQPIQQTVNDFRLTGTWSGERYQIQAGYILSVFTNGLDSVTADNPCFGRPAALPNGCGAGDGGPAGPASGRSSLAPDNIANSFFLSGGASLPWWRTRITGNFGWSLQLQNANFLPQTNNPAFAANPLLALPAPSLDGRVQTILLNLSAVSRPLPPLTLTLKYRFFDYDDQTDTLTFPAHILDDRGPISEDPKDAQRFSYRRNDLFGNARWRFAWPVSLTLGGGWERYDRNPSWEVQVSNEYFAQAVVDATPIDWALIRLLYIPSFRRIGTYNTFAHAGHVVQEDPEAALQFQSVLLRKYNEANRNRQAVRFELTITPIESVTITNTVGHRYDDYYDSPLGLQRATSWEVGADIAWRPTERFTAFAGYVWERYDSFQRSRSRPVTGTETFDFPDFDWVSENNDTIYTIRAGIQAALIPKTLDLRLAGTYENALGKIISSNPVMPTSGTPAQRTTATAQSFPPFSDQLFQFEAGLRYSFLKNWNVAARYVLQVYENSDWRNNNLTPFVPGVSSIWLGNKFKNYTAQWVGVSVGYSFR